MSAVVIRAIATALEVAVLVANDSSVIASTTTKLSGWIESVAGTALLALTGSVGDNVVVDIHGGITRAGTLALDVDGFAAQVVAWVESSVWSAALEVSVSVLDDAVGGAAEFGGWIVSDGSAASKVGGDLLVVQRDFSFNSRAALSIVAQTIVSTALVGVGVGQLVDLVNAAKCFGGVKRL